MKKMIKRILAFSMALVMMLSVQQPQVAMAASADARYSGGYTIEDILTYFQYFTKEDCTITNHTVGPIAVGGTLNAASLTENAYLKTIGDGARTPSYAKILKAGQVGNASGYEGTCKDFYYGSFQEGNKHMQGVIGNFTQNDGYMDIAGNYSKIEDESAQLATLGVAASIEGDVIVCDFNQNPSYTITYDQFYAASTIHIKLDDLNKVQTNEYIINITGIAEQNVSLTVESGNGKVDSNIVYVKMNNGESQEYFKALSGGYQSGQVNFSGMKLIFNFPDATGIVEPKGIGGHIVAPKAAVHPKGGRFEGNVIAKSVYSEAEAHYYPFNKILEDGTVVKEPTQPVQPVQPENIQLIKEYVVSAGGARVSDTELPTTSAVFALYKNEACTVEVTGLESVTADKGADGKYYVTILGSNLATNTTYYLKEKSAPDGYTINTTVYSCVVDGNGKITYKANGVDVAGTPVCENVKEAAVTPTGALEVIVREKDTQTPVENVSVSVKGDNSTETQNLKTDADGKTGLNDLPLDKYTVTLDTTTLPSKYKLTESTSVSQEKDVIANGTTTYIFEVELKKGDLTVTVKDEESKETIPNADVVLVNKESGEETTVNTGETGTVTVKDLPVGEYEVKTETVPEGYKKPENPERAEVKEGESSSVVVELPKEATTTPTGAIEIIVRENNTEKTPVSGVTVTVKGSNSAETKTLETEETTGKTGLNDLPVDKYTVTLDTTTLPDKYKLTESTSVSQKQEVNANGTTTYIFEVELKKGDLTVTVKDEESKETIPNADVVLVNKESGEETTVNTGETGTVTVKDLPVGEYEVKTETVPEGYKKPENPERAEVKEGESSSVVVELPKETPAEPQTGALEVIVREKGTQTPVGNVTVSVKGDNSTETKTLETEETTGKTGLNDLPVDKYTVTLDTTTLPSKYKLTESTKASQKQEVKANGTTTYIFEVELKKGDLTVAVKDEESKEIIPNADVVLVNKDTGNKTTVNTGETGTVTVKDLPVGEYEVKTETVPEGYKKPENPERAEVKEGESSSVVVELPKEIPAEPQTGALEVIVREKDTQTPVGNVTVSVKGDNSTETKTLETEETTGKTGLNDLPLDKYTVTLDTTTLPDKYKLTESTSVSQKQEVNANGTTTYIFEVELKKGDLTVTIKDEESKEIIPNADVVLVNKDTGNKTIVNTGLTGTVTIKDLPVGEYEIKTETVPEGYKKPENPEAVEIKEGEPSSVVVELPKVISTDATTGTLEIIVTDNRNGNKIAGATAEVKDENGNKVATGITDNAGQITIQNLPTGMYTVVVTEKIGDYTVVTKTERTQEVTANATTTYEYKAEKLGTLEITVTDEVTQNVVPNAKVEVKDATGKVVAAGTTDTTGKLKVEKLPVGDYTVIITEVPDGFTVTTDKEIKKGIEANKSTSYEFKVKKEVKDNNSNSGSNGAGTTSTPTPTNASASANTPATAVSGNGAAVKAPKTGDDTPVMAMLTMMMLAGAGICLMKRTKKQK